MPVSGMVLKIQIAVFWLKMGLSAQSTKIRSQRRKESFRHDKVLKKQEQDGLLWANMLALEQGQLPQASLREKFFTTS